MPDRTDIGAPPGLSFEPLTPVAFLDRAAAAHADRVAVVDGAHRFTYAQLHDRCRRLAGGLAPLAQSRPVAVLAPNTHVLLEAHFGVPWAGVPLVAINTRLSPGEVAYILEHSEAAVLIHDPTFDDLVGTALDQLPHPPHRIRTGDDGQYEALLAGAAPLALTPTDDTGRDLSEFRSWLATEKPEQLVDLDDDSNFTHLDNVIEVTGSQVRMTRPSHRLVVVSAKGRAGR